MRRAIRPAALALLALVLCAAAPAADVRAAPPGAVQHGGAAWPTVLPPRAVHGLVPDDEVGGSGVAFDGTNYLVVWTENRADGPTVYGARVTPDGTVLDQGAFAIAALGGSGPAVAFDG